jgi:hypothetical protein
MGQMHAAQRALTAWAMDSALSFRFVEGDADIIISFQREDEADPAPFHCTVETPVED